MTFTHALATNNYGEAKFIVSADPANATHTTIAAALAVASSGDTIFIRQGTYTEDLTLVDGVNLCSFNYEDATIVGKLTATFAGTCSIIGLTLQTNADYALSITGTAATMVNVLYCNIIADDNTAILHSSSDSGSALSIFWCKGNINTTDISMFSDSSAGGLDIEFCKFDNDGASTTASTKSAGQGNIKWTGLAFPLTVSDTAAMNCHYVQIFTSNTNTISVVASGSDIRLFDCHLHSGTAAGLDVDGTCRLRNSSIYSSNTTSVITGDGTLYFNNLITNGTGYLITTATQIAENISVGAYTVIAPSSWPHTVQPSQAVILVDSGTDARGITLHASPVTGEQVIIKDADGNASSNNITITPASGNIDGAATYVISSDYAAARLIYNGSEWSLI